MIITVYTMDHQTKRKNPTGHIGLTGFSLVVYQYLDGRIYQNTKG